MRPLSDICIKKSVKKVTRFNLDVKKRIIPLCVTLKDIYFSFLCLWARFKEGKMDLNHLIPPSQRLSCRRVWNAKILLQRKMQKRQLPGYSSGSSKPQIFVPCGWKGEWKVPVFFISVIFVKNWSFDNSWITMVLVVQIPILSPSTDIDQNCSHSTLIYVFKGHLELRI